MNNEVKVGDVVYFRPSWNKKKDKESFVGYDPYGKVIISDKVLFRGGFFKISSIKKEADNYYLVSLGERQKSKDLYPDINLEEAKEVFKKFDFDTFEVPLSFKAYGEDRNEVQLLAWHKKHSIFVNGTTWRSEGKDHFNDLRIYAPNYLATFEPYSKGQLATSIREVTIDVVNSFDDEMVLTSLLKLASCSENKLIQMYFVEDGEDRCCDLYSYAYSYMGFSEGVSGMVAYEKFIYEKLPQGAKDFIRRNKF